MRNPAGGPKRKAVILFLCAWALHALISPPRGDAANAGRVEIRGLESIGEEEFLNMFCTKPGSPVSAERVRDGIKRAFLKGLFEDISVEVPDGENPPVYIDVRERDFIRKIYLSGDYALSAKVIRRLFLLKEGQVMRYDLVGTATATLKEDIGRYGFPEAEIAVKIVRTDRPYRVDVHLTVDTGIPLLIRNIKINVIPPYPSFAKAGERGFAGEMKLAIGDRYDQVKLEDDLRRIKEYFKENGYYKPVAGPYSYRSGELEIVLNPGLHMTVAFHGNSALSTKILMREVPFFEIEDFNDSVVEESVARMISLYHERGYPFAQVAPVINTDDRNIDVSFFVYEGERIKVKSVGFGGTDLPQDRLKDVLSLKEGESYNPDLLESDKASLKEFFGSLGYLDASVRNIDAVVDRTARTAEIHVDMEEGKKTSVVSVGITGVPPEVANTLTHLGGIKPGDPYNEVDISNARFRILDYFDNSGYPDTDVIVTRSIENYGASLIFKIEEGKKKFFGKTIVSGNRQTRYEVIKRELEYKEGQPYSFRSLAEARQRLYRLGLFTDVEIGPSEDVGDKKDILVSVEEGKAGSVEFGLGYADYEKFRGFAEVSYRNLWGMNRVGSFRTELSSLENRFILQYNEPWFLGRSLPFRAFLLYENRKEFNLDNKEVLYKLTRYGATAGVEKKLSDTMKGELYYDFSLVNTRSVKPDVVLSKEDTGTLAISGIKPAVVYDTRDNPFDPARGFLAGIQMKVASFVFLSETNFVKLEAYGSRFQRLSRRIVMALSVRGGAAFGYRETNELPIVERFFLGGRSTVRGYEQDTLGPKGADGNPTGGNAFLMGNLEFRTSVGRGFGVVAFFDTGNVWVKVKDMNPGKLKYTAGLGLRYDTPVGPLRVDYGFKLNKQPGESVGEVHFSVGQAF
jgi:outer membrane protein insertion porin family